MQIRYEDVTVFIVTWKRPVTAQRLVSLFKSFGPLTVWVWCNENAPEPEGADVVFKCSKNIGLWQRFALASMVSTTHVLYCDDDFYVTAEGMKGLLQGAFAWPGRVVGLWGWRFLSPYDHFKLRRNYHSHILETATEVDMVSPCGMLAPKYSLHEAFGHVPFWRLSAERTQGHFSEDLPICLALSKCSGGRPMVVPSAGEGLRLFPDASQDCALGRRTEYREIVYRMLPDYRNIGWSPIQSEPNNSKSD